MKNLLTNFTNKMKEKKSVREFMYVFMLVYIFLPAQVYAAQDYLKPVNNTKTLLLAFSGAVGGVILVWGIIKFGLAWIKHNQGQEHEAVFYIAGGAIMAFASAIVAVITA